MKTLVAAALSLSLAGCAWGPRPQSHVVPHPKPAAVQEVPVIEPAPATPNQIVKRRWYSKFKVHPKWFH